MHRQIRVGRCVHVRECARAIPTPTVCLHCLFVRSLSNFTELLSSSEGHRLQFGFCLSLRDIFIAIVMLPMSNVPITECYWAKQHKELFLSDFVLTNINIVFLPRHCHSHFIYEIEWDGKKAWQKHRGINRLHNERKMSCQHYPVFKETSEVHVSLFLYIRHVNY